MTWEIRQGDVMARLREMPDVSVTCVITSPPYWGLRDYGVDGQIGVERTPDEYVARMVEVFAEIRRVLRKDGTCWLNLGDSYAGSGKGPSNSLSQAVWDSQLNRNGAQARAGAPTEWLSIPSGLKPKDLIGIPWRVALALQADGWWLRSDIIWAKPNPMPESVADRPTRAHEYVFLLTKSARYWYDAEAIREAFADERMGNPNGGGQYTIGSGRNDRGALKTGIWERGAESAGRNKRDVWAIDEDEWAQFQAWKAANAGNKRDVWTIATEPYAEAHFATFPTALVEPCILAGCPEGGTVLDPFCGSGTTLMVALRHERSAIGIELNPDYVQMARRRIIDDASLLNSVAEVSA